MGPRAKWLTAALVGFAMLWAGPAQAGDFAERDILGFSASGRYFAFEQFGRQDGSGFAYAEIQVIDSTADAWVPGSPIRVLLRDEAASITTARAKARAQAAPILEKLAIDRAGSLLASNPPAELGHDPLKLRVNARYPLSGEADPMTFELEQIPLAAAQCATLSDRASVGFRLLLKHADRDPKTLHRDTEIPHSRGCPLRYALSDVIRYRGPDQATTYAVLISVFRIGFEGPDRRFLAVTHNRP